jgi:hypothetical protein
MRRFFETAFILQEPAYSSIYPPGQGLILAAGERIFKEPWAGILIASGLLCALCYWSLRAWTAPVWALAGGFLAVLEFGPLGQWTNQYWGGLVPGIAGCFVFGALPGLRKRGGLRDAILLGTGLGLQLITRPFEFGLLLLFAVGYLLPAWKKIQFLVLVFPFIPAAALTLFHNKNVTGHWTTLPYALSQQKYGVPTTFVFQPLPKPEKKLTREQQDDFEAQSDVHDEMPNSFKGFVQRWVERIPVYGYFFPLPLLATLPFFLLSFRTRRFAAIAAVLILFSIGTNFFPYFYPNYVSSLIPMFLLITVTALANLGRIRIRGFSAGRIAACMAGLIYLGQFAWFFGLRMAGNDTASNPNTSWGLERSSDYRTRVEVIQRIDRLPGKQLVFVNTGGDDDIDQWIQNSADIDHSRVVWALDLGPEEDAKLLAYYTDRTPWKLRATDSKFTAYK